MNHKQPPLSGAEYLDLRTLIQDDPEQAWTAIPPFVRTADALEASAILEEIVDLHCDQFLERLIAAAMRDTGFAEALTSIHLGDMDGPCIDRLGEWQDRVRAGGTATFDSG